MTAKEYLQQVKHKDAEIKNLCRDKESVKEMLYSLGGMPDGERVQSSRNNDKFGTPNTIFCLVLHNLHLLQFIIDFSNSSHVSNIFCSLIKQLY